MNRSRVTLFMGSKEEWAILLDGREVALGPRDRIQQLFNYIVDRENEAIELESAFKRLRANVYEALASSQFPRS